MKFKDTLCLGAKDPFLIRVETIYCYIFDPSWNSWKFTLSLINESDVRLNKEKFQVFKLNFNLI